MRIAISLFCASVILSACGVIEPSFMPAGYKYHQEEFKAPPGPEADDVGYDFTPEANEKVMQDWYILAHDVFDKLEPQAGLKPGQTIYLAYDRPNVFNASYDHALRQVLREKGYTLAKSPRLANTTMRAEAYLKKDKAMGRDVVRYNDEPRPASGTKLYEPEDSRTFIFALETENQGKRTARVESLRTIPGYGYLRGEGQRGHPVDPPAPR
ncbi:MAG: hypothetical protein L6Q57_00030 [Alphaproteobacteria bacterium]|nr:hypothetical protein [Alphaproteobacteria bacterium]